MQIRRRHPLQFLAWSHSNVQASPHVEWTQLCENIQQQRALQLEAYTDAWLSLAHRYSQAEHQQSCSDIPGYSPQDVLRLHVVMFHIS